MLVESDFPSEGAWQGWGGRIWKGGSRDVKREKGHEGTTWRQTKCESVCVCASETEILSTDQSKERLFLSICEPLRACQNLPLLSNLSSSSPQHSSPSLLPFLPILNFTLPSPNCLLLFSDFVCRYHANKRYNVQMCISRQQLYCKS